MLLKESKEDLNQWKENCVYVLEYSIELTCQFSTNWFVKLMQFKDFLVDIDVLILKFTWKSRGTRMGPFCKRRRRMWAESHYPILTLAVKLCWAQDRGYEEEIEVQVRETVESRSRPTQICSVTFLRVAKAIQWRKNSLSIWCSNNQTSMCRNTNFSTSHLV